MDITVTYSKNYLDDGELFILPTTSIYPENNAFVKEGLERNNYIFLCWNTNSNNTGTVYYPGDTISQDLMLYAIWEPVCYLTSEATLTSIANTIRANNGESTLYSFPEGFISGIENIEELLFFSYVNGTLTSINLSNVFNIPQYTFAYRSELTTVNFPDCTLIESSAFCYCYNLTSINFPACITIGESTFYSCSNLISVNFPSCTTIGIYAFGKCSSLTSINFPTCTSIETQGFYYCSNLTSVNFPVCTSIGRYAFYSCYNLTSINLPACISIESSAFGSCSNLTSIYLNRSSICTLGNSEAFDGTKITSSTGSIYVPASLLTGYKSALNWSYFSTRFFSIT